MILPSDDNSTPEQRPKSRKSDPDPEQSAEDEVSEAAGPPVWMPEELWKNLPNLLEDFAGTEEDEPMLSQQEWREMLQHELLAAMEELENFPDPECDYDPPDPPDLYTFHAELIALRQTLKSGQKLVLQKLEKAAVAVPQGLAVQLGILAGELRGGGQTEAAERLLKLIEEFS